LNSAQAKSGKAANSTRASDHSPWRAAPPNSIAKMKTKLVYGKKASAATRGNAMLTPAFVRNANACSYFLSRETCGSASNCMPCTPCIGTDRSSRGGFWLLPETSGQGLCCSCPLQISVTHATTSPIGISRSAQPGPGSTTGGTSIGGAFVGIGPRSAACATAEKASNNANGTARKRMRTPLVQPKIIYIKRPKDASPICLPCPPKTLVFSVT
jgi:hypothetical protein